MTEQGPETGAGAPATNLGAVRVAIVDDHRMFLEGLQRSLADTASLRIVAAVPSWPQLVRHPAYPVDVVVLDLELKDGVPPAVKISAARAAGAAVVVVTALDDDSSRDRSLGAGAAAFVSKTLPVGDLVAVARRVAAGERMARPGAAASAGHEASDDLAAPADAGLSDAERRALVLYAQGLSTAEVARQMSVGYETAKTYLRRARDKYAKVGRPAGRRAELIRRVAEDGLLE